jgi:tetratricopeptide (TPR) repeat protein
LDGLDAISDQLDNIGSALLELQDVAYGSLDALYSIDATLREGFERTAELLLEQKALLVRISDQLAKPYEQQTLELRREAHKWLLRGMSGNGIDPAQDISDAQLLLATVIDNPIGRQDYVAWFQLGWINWKSNKISVAAENFKNAARLSEMSNDLYLVESLRHLAYMHYLDGDHDAAHDWCNRAAKGSATADVLFDMARYCWLTGRRQQALDTLAKAIKMKPWLYVAMLSEEDWLNEASGGRDW